MAEDLGERTEAPTPRRLSEARGRGQVARSADFSAAIDLTVGVVLIALFGGAMVTLFTVFMRSVLGDMGASTTLAHVPPLLAYAAWTAARAVGPILALLVVAAAAAQLAQVGLHVTLHPLAPNLARLNPVNGIGNLFGRRGNAKTIVNVFKLAAVLAVAVKFILGAAAELAYLPRATAVDAIWAILMLGARLAAWLLAILLIMGIADFVYQRWQHKRDLRMTKADVKDERRSLEGDPQVKSYRFKMAQRIAMQRINQAVPRADVVVTNPTHYAVALAYEPARMRAPRVVAKGADLMAQRVRQVAMIHGVPIVERPPLARALYAAVEVGREVPPEHYQAVAEILAYVYRLNEAAA